MTPPKALVKKGRRSPGPRTPSKSDDPSTDPSEIMSEFRANARAILRAVHAAESDERAAADVVQVITHAKATSRDLLENDRGSDEWRRDQARRLSDLVWELEQGRGTKLSGIGTDRYLRAALEIGAILTDLGAYYWRPPHGPATYDDRHFDRMDYYMAKGLKKKTAAKKVLKETFSKLPGDLENMANGLCQAYDRARRRAK